MMKKYLVRCALLMLLTVGLSYTISAQPEENGGDPPNNDAPLDGGISILIAAGVGYGAKKMHAERNKNQKK